MGTRELLEKCEFKQCLNCWEVWADDQVGEELRNLTGELSAHCRKLRVSLKFLLGGERVRVERDLCPVCDRLVTTVAIREIQRREGNWACCGTAIDGWCSQGTCVFYPLCVIGREENEKWVATARERRLL